MCAVSPLVDMQRRMSEQYQLSAGALAGTRSGQPRARPRLSAPQRRNDGRRVGRELETLDVIGGELRGERFDRDCSDREEDAATASTSVAAIDSGTQLRRISPTGRGAAAVLEIDASAPRTGGAACLARSRASSSRRAAATLARRALVGNAIAAGRTA